MSTYYISVVTSTTSKQQPCSKPILQAGNRGSKRYLKSRLSDWHLLFCYYLSSTRMPVFSKYECKNAIQKIQCFQRTQRKKTHNLEFFTQQNYFSRKTNKIQNFLTKKNQESYQKIPSKCCSVAAFISLSLIFISLSLIMLLALKYYFSEY